MSRFKILVVLLVVVLAFGCSHKRRPAATDVTSADDIRNYENYERFRYNYEERFNSTYTYMDAKAGGWDDRKAETLSFHNPRSASSSVLRRAELALGTPYVFGGTQPGGFDCSGLVRWAYQGAGIRLPRTAREQSNFGYRVSDRSKLRAGDIVAFRRPGGGYHTGIYVGDGKFIHAPRTNSRVRVESMESGYFDVNYIGARRVDMRNGDAALAATARADQERMAANRRSSGRDDRAERRSGRDDDRKSARRDRSHRDRDDRSTARRDRSRKDGDERSSSRSRKDRDDRSARSSRDSKSDVRSTDRRGSGRGGVGSGSGTGNGSGSGRSKDRTSASRPSRHIDVIPNNRNTSRGRESSSRRDEKAGRSSRSRDKK